MKTLIVNKYQLPSGITIHEKRDSKPMIEETKETDLVEHFLKDINPTVSSEDLLALIDPSGDEIHIGPLDEMKEEDEIIDDDMADYDISGYITKYMVEDSYGDIVNKGALDEVITKYNSTMKGSNGYAMPMLFQHNNTMVAGKWMKFESDEVGVKGYAKFNQTTVGKDIQMLCKEENSVIGGFSIGFMCKNWTPIKNDDDEVTGRMFNKIDDLFETSIVLRPAVESATITELKSDEPIDVRLIERLLREAGASKSIAKAIIHETIQKTSKE